MKFRKFGETSLSVSELCLGTWGIGGAGWDQNPEEVKDEAIRKAYEEGINIFDTAPAYNGGEAERILGRELDKLGIRKDVLISTKCGNEFIDGKYVQSGRREKILRECDESLKNLRTDYIDLYLLHWPEKDAEPEETIGAMAELKKAGKVRFLGLSNHSIAQIEEAKRYAEIDFIQVQYSMLVKEQAETMKWASEQGMGVMGYGSLGGGILTGRYRVLKEYETMDSRNRFYQYFKEPGWSKVQMLLKVMDEISAERNVSLSSLALNWTLQNAALSTALFGTQHAERVMENCRALEDQLMPEDFERINDTLAELGI